MLKRNLKIFTALNKEVKVKIKNQAIKLREELKFMSRLVVVSRKREEFDRLAIKFLLRDGRRRGLIASNSLNKGLVAMVAASKTYLLYMVI